MQSCLLTGGCAFLAVLLFATFGLTQPDVTVSNLPLGELSKNGTVGTVTGYSLGSTSCNIGSSVAAWDATTNQHPVIAGNIYRINNAGQLRQIGMSWLKHAFCAVNEFSCGPCSSTSCETLGVGCADTYSAELNGDQEDLGPRSDVNPSNGFFTYPFPTQGLIGDAIYKRCQVQNDDLNPALNPDASYFGVIQYITTDEPAFDRHHNNNSYREIVVGALLGGGYLLEFTGSTNFQKDPIHAWQDLSSGVQRSVVATPENAGAGQLVVGSRAVNIGGGLYQYQYAIFNNTSDRAARSFGVPIPSGVVVNNPQFGDVAYHSGEPFSGNDWTSVEGGATLSWSTQTFNENPNANALRWGTTYSFSFVATAPPDTTVATIGLFKPGAGGEVTVGIMGPAGDFTQPVTNLACFYAADAAQLTWSNGEVYSIIQVGRDGNPLVSLPGSATSYSDPSAPQGLHEYDVLGVAGGLASPERFCTVNVPATPPLTFEYQVAAQEVMYDPGVGTGTFFEALQVEEDAGNSGFPHDITGFSMSLTHDGTLLTPVDVQPGPVLAATNGGTGPEFFQPAYYPDGLTLGVIIQLQGAESITAVGPQAVATAEYHLNEVTLLGDFDGEITTLVFANGLSPAVFNSIVIAGGVEIAPSPGFAAITLTPDDPETHFIRGEADSDGLFNGLLDAIFLLNFAFIPGSPVPGCMDAVDIDDDGVFNGVLDGLFMLNFAFVPGSPPIPDPGPLTCGPDPTKDALECENTSCP